jgi:hypothetical protein
MSRYSPQVLPVAGAGFADALLQGVNSYMQTRQMRRREKLEDSAESRAMNVDRRADEQLVINQNQDTRAAGRYGVEMNEAPVRQGMLESSARDMGVVYRGSGREVPADAENIRGVPDYYLDSEATKAAQAMARADALATIAGERVNVQREAVEARERMNSETVRGRVAAQRIRSTSRPGGAGGVNSAPLREAGAQLRKAMTDRAAIQRALNDNPGDPDLLQRLDATDADVRFFEGQQQTLLRSAAPVPLPERAAPAPAGPQMFTQPFSSMFDGRPNLPQRGDAPAPQAVTPRPAQQQPRAQQALPARPAGSATPNRPTREQINQQAAQYLNMGVDPAVVEQKKRDLLRSNGYN